MYDSMQIFILCRTVSFPLNLLGHETFNESSLKVGSGETKQNVLIQSCDVTGGSLNPPELCVCLIIPIIYNIHFQTRWIHSLTLPEHSSKIL